jgi:predicted metal-dependent enzyme (double-stranded beta helix superfamily)
MTAATATATVAGDPSSSAPPASTVARRPASHQPLAAHVLADIAAGFAAARPLWEATVRHDPDGRRPVRLVATERYEVWVIGWTTGQNVRPHDHGDAAGAFVVAEGELTEVLPAPGRGTVERTHEAGRLRVLGLGAVHDVVNRAAAPATSIHVYSPPLSSMTYYDAETFEPLETESMAPEEAVLDHRAGSYVLHPSRRTTP